VTCDDDPTRGNGLGRRTVLGAARYSAVCAIQNMWLAARVDALGVGWISILQPAELRALLAIPRRLEIIASLCVGHAAAFAPVADLERYRLEARSAGRRLGV